MRPEGRLPKEYRDRTPRDTLVKLSKTHIQLFGCFAGFAAVRFTASKPV